MRKVSIHTAQNILIDFQLASLMQRVLGFLIDFSVMAAGIGILALILVSINPNLAYFLPILFVFYTPVSEMLMNGQTLGKKAMNTRVVNVNGKEPTALDFFIRWVFRLLDIYLTAGSFGIIFISTTARGQRLGGVLSNTMVVSLSSEMNLNLNDILRIEDRSKYTPQYVDAYRFSEDEMLTVKALIDRYSQYRNPAHANLIIDSANRCAAVIGINEVPENKVEFLKTILRDYIVLTRS